MRHIQEIRTVKLIMLNNIIDRIRLPFRKEKELYYSLYEIMGICPHDISYYKQALMHKSIMHRNKKGKPVNNERLEFLGDAVLDCAVGDIVYRHFPNKREGFLTNTRSKLVQRDTLNRLAQELGINSLIKSGGRPMSHNSYMGGNAFEALVGALYLDHGYSACMRFLEKRILKQMINIDKVAYKEVNFKSKLIEWTQKNKVQLEFRFVSSGKDTGGSPTFSYQVLLEGIAGSTGDGFSKKESQQKASRDTLARLRREPQFIDQVFAAKGERTKMEEEPVQSPPDVSAATAFMTGTGTRTGSKRTTSFQERVYSESDSAVNEYKEKSVAQEMESDVEEFDLSDISAKEKSREDIIAEAEKAAFDSAGA